MERHAVGRGGDIVALPAVLLGRVPAPYLGACLRIERAQETAAAEIGVYPGRAHISAGSDARLDEIVVEPVRLEAGGADDHLAVIDQRRVPHHKFHIGLFFWPFKMRAEGSKGRRPK